MVVYLKRGLIAILLAFSLLFSMVPQVYSAAVISHPGGTTIDVNWGEAFLLRHRLEWSESGEKGYYSITIYWDCLDNKPSENFTFENASAYFDNGDAIESIVTFKERPVGTGTRFTVNVRNATGDFKDGQFTVDIWLRAAGAEGVPHSATDNHPIYYSGIDVAESSIVSEVPSPITVRVHELSAVIYPSDDADVYERYPDSNYGSSTSIWVSPYDNRKNRGFLKFGLSGIPSGAIIRQAKLYLHCWRKEYDNFDAACCGVENDDWSENTITWNNQPNYSISLDDQEIIGVGWYAWDVTVFVAEEFSGDNVTSFCLKGAVEPHGGRALFDSKEWRDNHPYLEVKYTLSAGSEGLSRSEENDVLLDMGESSENLKSSSTSLDNRDPIYIDGNENFTENNGVNGGGSGTEDDSYIIENWDISAENAHGVHIRNTTAYFIIRNCYVHDGGEAKDGIRFENVKNGKIDNATCRRNRHGVIGYGSSNCTVTNSTTENNIVSIAMVMIFDIAPENNRVENCTASNDIVGFEIKGGKNDNVENCTTSNNSDAGISLFPSDNIRVKNCVVENSGGYGIFVKRESDNNIIENCILLGAPTSPSSGIRFEEISDNNRVRNCTIKNKYHGILNQGSNNVIENCIIENNTYGIYQTGYNNGIYHNRFLKNENQAWDNGSNHWDDGYPSGGNYWSDYTGVDNYGGENQDIPGSDGIGDTPYSIPGDNNRDWYPLVVRSVEVSISPDYQSDLRGMTLTYIVIVKNTGNLSDTYDLTVNDDLGWGPSVSPTSLAIPAGENRPSTLSVTIPDNAVGCTQDNIHVTATSQENAEVSDNDSCIAHAAIWTGTATFTLENLYKVNLYKNNLWLSQGSKLVVKFYTYDNLFENEIIIHENFVLPWRVVPENENVAHPSGIGMKRARLDLTGDNTENVISTIASFVADRGILWTRLTDIRLSWPYATPAERSLLWAELGDIRLQWSYAPS